MCAIRSRWAAQSDRFDECMEAPRIDWAAVDAAPKADMPDDDSPELSAADVERVISVVAGYFGDL